jgi:small-conductance mechanosensitive channel/CRP-like cAMP-binding protein
MTAQFGGVLNLGDALALAGSFLVAGLIVTHLAFRERPLGRFLCRLASFAGFTAMLIVAGVTPAKPTAAIYQPLTYLVISVFKIVWWLAASWLLAGFLRAVMIFKRQPRETRFLQDIVAGFIYSCAILAIVADVFDIPVSGLIAASGIVAIILGLALQSTLGDVFSGIVLNVAKPYHPGDWVILEGGLQGRVVEMNWQATQILTPDNDLAIVPNSIIAKAKLVNASRPAARQAHGQSIVVRLDPAVAPLRACAIIETALLSSNRILRAPAPSVAIRSLDAVALECEVQFFVSQVELGPAARNEIFDLMFRHCKSAGIRFAPPPQSPLALPPRRARPAPAEMPRLLLEHLPIFAPLSEDERNALLEKIRRRIWKPGEVLIEQGAIARALYILGSGVLAARHKRGSRETDVFRLAPGDCFGQAGILTGAAVTHKVVALTNAVVYEIGKDDIAPILNKRPSIAGELGQILARREALEKEPIEELPDRDVPAETLGARLAERVKELFNLA